jgi:hypothetical protein
MVITTSDNCNALNSGNRTEINAAISKNTYSVSVTFPGFKNSVYVYGLVLDVACGIKITELGWRT